MANGIELEPCFLARRVAEAVRQRTTVCLWKPAVDSQGVRPGATCPTGLGFGTVPISGLPAVGCRGLATGL